MDQFRPHRVQADVACDSEKLLLICDLDGMKAPLKHMACEAVSFVEMLAVVCIEHMHAFRKVGMDCSEQQVEMIGHHAIRVHLELMFTNRVRQGVEPD